MIKIVTNEDLGDMSEWLTPACQNEPCSNCHEVKLAVKTGDIRQFCRLTHYPLEESKAGISACRQCMWFWVDEVEELDEEQPLTPEELRNMAGQWVWVEFQYEHNKCDG